MAKEDYTFTRISEDTFNFKALRISSLEVKVVDSEGEPLEDVFITVSAGKTILKG